MNLFVELLNNLNSGGLFSVSGYSLSSFSLFIALLKEYTSKNIVVVVPDRETGFELQDNIEAFSKSGNAVCYNLSKFFPFSHILTEKLFASETMSMLYSLVSGKENISILPCSALLKKFTNPKNIFSNIINLKKGDTLDREALALYLIEYGYENEYILSDKGEFSFRGDIADIYIPVYSNPVRITLWDDYIENISFFNIKTQKRFKNRDVKEISIVPNCEFIFSDVNIDAVIKKLKTKRESELSEILKLKNFDINIAMCPYLAGEDTVSIFDFIASGNNIFVFFNAFDIFKNIKKYEKELVGHFSDIFDEGIEFVSYNSYFYKAEDILSRIESADLLCDDVEIHNRNRKNINLETREYEDLHKQIKESANSPFTPLEKEFNENVSLGFTTFCPFSDKVRKENVFSFARKSGLPVEETDTLLTELLLSSKKRKIYFAHRDIGKGFKSSFLKVSVISERDIYGKSRRVRKTEYVKEHSLRKFSELKKGDYVVHVEHGIGLFKGLEHIEIAGVKKEFILLEYLKGDKLYVPVEKFNYIQKYIGDDGYIPSVDKLGSDRWSKNKIKVQQAVEFVAKELLELYASRKIIKGISFRGNEQLIDEFGEKWEYDLTNDQVKAINDIFDDMDKEYPMDRLLCGDVGYGKTEVALRAVLKAVFAGYQVAFLVPTTILTLQHFTTFKERFKEYPVNVEKISRFEDKKQQKKIVEKTEKGEIDVLIGTHRLLQKDVKWRNLGLLIIDEEHKFGVKHKEKIQMIRKNLDVLSMTATPIPRTLQMACLGVKDLSVINTPPMDRKSIDTKIIKFDKKIIRRAVLKEIERGGQVYFVHNRIKSIYQTAELLKEFLPEVKIAVAYGQMDKEELEIIYRDFINKKFDMLVSTTIIESGLDNPNVNTILINRADRFGISQLYQLRGRVGRSNIKAYAYFIIPAKEIISSVALKRLKILQTYAGLSEGFKLAMSDLEIRGAGNLFGEKQSGHILSVGFEFYMDMLEDAIKKLKGVLETDDFETEINYNINAFIPESFIAEEKERLYVYKKLSLVKTEEEFGNIIEELEDRFGKFPEEFKNLTNVLKIKILLKIYAIPRGDIKSDSIVLFLDQRSKIDPVKVISLVKSHSDKFLMLNQNSLKIVLYTDNMEKRYHELKETLKLFELKDKKV